MGQKKTTIQTGTWSPSWGYSLEASASMAKYPTTDNKRNGTNYWTTGSTIIPAVGATIVSASWANVDLSTNNLISSSIATGSIAKVSISSSYFTSFFNSTINNSNDVKSFSILSYNGIVSTLNGFNEYSSSTFNSFTESFAVIYVSASRASMGNVVTNPLVVTLGITQNSSVTRNGNNSTTNVSESMAFATKYPTNTNRTNKGTTYGYPSTSDTARFVRTKTNVTDIAAYVVKYPNNTTKAGWVDDISPKNQ
jgi:hypothetical protein